MAAEMHDAFHAGDGFLDLREIGEIGGNKVIAGSEIGRLAYIACPDAGINAAQNLTQSRADITGGAGNENVLHYSLPLSNSVRIDRVIAAPSLHFCLGRSMLTARREG